MQRRLGHAQGRDERGHPRLDHQRRDDALPDRLGGRPAPLPDAGARPAGGDRPTRRARRCSSARAGCPTRWSPASAAARTPSASSTRSSDDPGVRLLGAEAGGDEHGHAASLSRGRVSVLHGSRATCWPTRTARWWRRTPSRPASTTPASAPSTRWLKYTGRASYEPVTDAEALEAFHRLCRLEGIIPALESSHALALALQRGRSPARGDRDRPVGPRRQGRGRGRGARACMKIETPALSST